MRVLLYLLAASLAAEAQPQVRKTELTLMGHVVVLKDVESTAVHASRQDPASVCILTEPQPKCYKAPEYFIAAAKVERIQLDNKTQALLFTAKTMGVSGSSTHLALLVPNETEDLQDLLMDSERSISNQGQHQFLNEPTLSPAKILVTATYASGLNEGHYGPHRYFISTYTRQFYEDDQSYRYALADRYLTARKYDLETEQNIILSERNELLRRLRQAFPTLPLQPKK